MRANGTQLKSNFDFSTSGYFVLIAFFADIIFQCFVQLFKFNDAITTWICVVGNQVIFFGTCVVMARIKNVDLVNVSGVKRLPKWYFFPLFAFVALLCLCAFSPLASVFNTWMKRMGYSHTPNYHIPYGNIGLVILAGFTLGIFPAIGEELLLRESVMSGLKTRSPFFALVMSSLLFAMLHGNMVQLVHQFLLGMVMGYLALITHSIWASATVHFFNNVITVTVNTFAFNGKANPIIFGYLTGNYGTTATQISVSIIVEIVFVGALVATLFLISKLLMKGRQQEKFVSPRGTIINKINALIEYISGEKDEREKPTLRDYTSVGITIIFLALVILITFISETIQ